jgi:outer membrane protein TolC
MNRLIMPAITTLIVLGIFPQGSAELLCHAQNLQSSQAGDSQFTLGAEQATAYCQKLTENPAAPASWWNDYAHQSLLGEPDWILFDISTVMVDALTHNPRIGAVKHRTAIAMEQIIQEDAAFDANVLLESRVGRTGDPVGNTLTTGGPDRLIEESWNNRAGIVKTTRKGTAIDLSQQSGLLNSNSQFFDPRNQGNARLSLSLTKPLLAGSGTLYNERLLLQARIDSRLTWQELLREVQTQVGGVMGAFWQLYEARCHLLQNLDALHRANAIAAIIEGRQGFDSGPLELVKVRTRIARLNDRVIESQRNVLNQQVLLMQLVNSPTLTPGSKLELIPNGIPFCSPLAIDPRDAILTGVNHRTDVHAAAMELESAALAIKVSRNELLPQLDAVVSGYLAALNGRNDIGQSLVDQFTEVPGVSGGLVYERPYGNRAAKSKLRSSHQRYLEMGQRYREAIALTSSEIALAVQNLNAISIQSEIKARVLVEAVQQEKLIRQRWEVMGTDGRFAALVLEDLLEQLELRTAAENDYVSNHVNYLLSLIELQKAMGTLLLAEGIEPLPTNCISEPVAIPLPNSEPAITSSTDQSPHQSESTATARFQLIDAGVLK